MSDLDEVNSVLAVLDDGRCPVCREGKLRVEPRPSGTFLRCIRGCSYPQVRAAVDALADVSHRPRPKPAGRPIRNQVLTTTEALAKIEGYGRCSANRALVDICDCDRDAGAILSEILFWAGKAGGVDRPDCNHKPSERCGCPQRHWVAIDYGSFWDAQRIPERSASRAIARLRSMELVVSRQWLFAGRNINHYSIQGPELERRLLALPRPGDVVRHSRTSGSARNAHP